ncbi:flavin reductase family protein [Clostridium algoriphilum]|uniref:flavin reductase family protein n=1 Tax=Clostridium algoriphilum TaxID=198347 RepID=UPI001CF241E2|nr:flavin reductase family protein [Clostridium algoriphilum]MCB2292296.1 flavin reductase family protein [Clostridium algoriphilum]
MKVNFTENLEKGIEFLRTQGAFLTVKSGDNINTMTIGWGNVGYIWYRPIFTVMVRKSRYTHELIESSNNFTVSIPLSKNLKNQLMVCGSKSGRDINKFKECNLTLEDSKKVDSPIIGECELHYECKIVYKQEMNSELLSKDIVESSYKDGDYHTLYYGEIVDAYTK